MTRVFSSIKQLIHVTKLLSHPIISYMDKSEEHLRLIQLTKQNSNQRDDGRESKNSSHISGVVGSRSGYQAKMYDRGGTKRKEI